MSPLYRYIYSDETLWKAWRKVRESAATSSSQEIRSELMDFEARMPTALSDIQRDLRRQEFHFRKQKGIAKRKSSGGHRPLVIAPIQNRIVQRALLDALQQKNRYIKSILETESSFGGIKGKRVRDAVLLTKELSRNGKTHYIRSDIPSFFTKIDKDKILELLRKHIRCSKTFSLLQSAITTDLINLGDLERKGLSEIFPIGPEGVAQGSPLSPLLANIYLHEFDKTMNSNGGTCLRYIDDFLLLGASYSEVDRAFNEAKKELGKLSLTAYAPSDGRDKAARGLTGKGVEFLGCQITPGLIQPSRGAITRFKEYIESEFDLASRQIRMISSGQDVPENYSFSSATYKIDKIILGWAKAFSFCDGTHSLQHLDDHITSLLEKLDNERQEAVKKMTPKQKRRLFGVRSIVDAAKPREKSDTTLA